MKPAVTSRAFSGTVARGFGVLFAMVVIGCGGPPKAPSPPSAPDGDAGTAAVAAPSDTTASGTSAPPAAAPSDAAASAASPASSPDAGSPAAAADARPFAHNAEEATSFMDDAITSRSNELIACVNDARARRKDVHAKIVVEIGIDQEGHLLGVKMPKGVKNDKPLTDCFLAALHGAPFPRSHAGVLTVRRTFEDKQVNR
jgi:hypothetical protein